MNGSPPQLTIPTHGRDGIAPKDYRPFRERRSQAPGWPEHPNVLGILTRDAPNTSEGGRAGRAPRRVVIVQPVKGWSLLKLKQVALRRLQSWQARSRMSPAQDSRLG